MYILDTCILNILFYSTPEAQITLKAKLEEVSDSQIWISVVSVYELLVVGIAPAINPVINKSGVVVRFAGLTKFLDDLKDYQILPYTLKDDDYFQKLEARVKRMGPLDCKIASSAVSNDFVVVTQNLDEFLAAGAKCEDWTIAPSH